MKQVIALVGPSGVGKTSYIKRLKEIFDFVDPSIATTRAKRDGDAKNYLYVSSNDFYQMADSGDFIEYDKYNGCFYGTLKNSVYDILDSDKKGILLDLTPAGCLQVKKELPDSIIIALLPDTPEWLRARLFERGEDSLEEIEKRIMLLDDFINEVNQLSATTVICKQSPSTWDGTFNEIVEIIVKNKKGVKDNGK